MTVDYTLVCGLSCFLFRVSLSNVGVILNSGPNP